MWLIRWKLSFNPFKVVKSGLCGKGLILYGSGAIQGQHSSLYSHCMFQGLVLDVPVDLVKSLKEGIASGYPNATLKRLLLLPSDVNSQARDSRSHEFATDYGNRRPSGFGERERRPSGFGDRERRDFGYHGRNQSFGRGYGRSGDGGREGLYRRDHRRNGEFRYQDRNRSYERNFRRDSSEYDGNYELRDQGEDDVDVNNSFMPYR